MSKKAQRIYEITELRAKKATEGDSQSMTVEGYAALFNRETTIEIPWAGISWREQIAPGAFSKSVSEGRVKALWNHDTGIILGAQENRSLNLREDNTGLWFEIKIPDTQAGRDAYTLIDGGFVRGMSFGFSVNKENVQEEKGKIPLRTIEDVTLYEVSATAFPAYPETSVASRDAESADPFIKVLMDKRAEQPAADPVVPYEDTPEFAKRYLYVLRRKEQMSAIAKLSR